MDMKAVCALMKSADRCNEADGSCSARWEGCGLISLASLGPITLETFTYDAATGALVGIEFADDVALDLPCAMGGSSVSFGTPALRNTCNTAVSCGTSVSGTPCDWDTLCAP
jgi:hypothetical protein